MKKALHGIGVAALVAWTAVGGYAWYQVKDGVELTLRDASPQRLDEFALLDDRLSALSGDLDALVASLEANFGLLADALGANGAEAAILGDRLARLEEALPHALSAREAAGALEATVRDLRGLLASLEVAPATAPVGALSTVWERSAADHSDNPAEPAGPSGEAPALDAAPEPLEAAQVVEPVVEDNAPARSFLAFRLPSRDFSFEGANTFDVLGDLSRVGFDAKSTLHDFTGISERVRGEFRVDLARAADGISGRIVVDSASLNTGLKDRDTEMLEHLDSTSFEELVFEPTSFEPAEIDVEGMRLDGVLVGRMSIRGVTREVRVDVRAHVDESRRLVIEGEVALQLSDFEVPVPNQLGVISMDDEVRVWLHLRARSRVAEAGG